MCVVLVIGEEAHRATPGMVEASWDANPHGGGVGWLEDGKAKWKKGILDYKEMQKFARDLPIPHILHFRIPSQGGPSKTLCHPFPVSADASVAFEGENDGPILFHNGTWTNWKDRVIDVAIQRGIELPDGKWSDTRAMAFIANHIGTRFLDLIDEKVVLLSPDKDPEKQLTFFGAWNFENGIFCSNLGWKNQVAYTRERRLLPAGRPEHGDQASDQRQLPVHYQQSKGDSQPAPGPHVGPGVRQHNAQCVCRECLPHDAFCGCEPCIEIRSKGGGSRPTQGETADPTPHLTEVRNAYYALSKGKLKRLRGKAQHANNSLTALERRIITYDRILRKRLQREQEMLAACTGSVH